MRLIPLVVLLCVSMLAPLASGQQTYDSPRALLESLETKGKEINRLSANITYAREYMLAGDTQRRSGNLRYSREDGPDGRERKKFAIEFTTLMVGDRIDRDDDAHREYIFDGEWLVRKEYGPKIIKKEQVVRPGDQADPLAIGEGPFPMPIGQAADEVLRLYDAELVVPTDGLSDENLLQYVDKSYQLKLIPKVPPEDDNDPEVIRLWYDRESLLPRLAQSEQTDGDIVTCLLYNVRTNNRADATDEHFSVELPRNTKGWHVEVREFEERVIEP